MPFQEVEDDSEEQPAACSTVQQECQRAMVYSCTEVVSETYDDANDREEEEEEHGNEDDGNDDEGDPEDGQGAAAAAPEDDAVMGPDVDLGQGDYI